MALLTFEEWVATGIAAGFCSDVKCVQHDLVMTDDEIVRFENGDDPCCFVVRVGSDGPS